MVLHLNSFSKLLLVAFLLSLAILNISAQESVVSFGKYHSPKEANEALQNFNSEYSNVTDIHRLAYSPRKNEISILEIGKETGSESKKLPAVLVAANMQGKRPISTEAALYLAKLITEKPEAFENLTWYILPNGNPDAAEGFFSKPLYERTLNGTAVNADIDEAADEDGPDDLNQDGLVTQMRIKSPDGKWLTADKDSRMMKKADLSKEEQGLYKLMSEGLDNDNDGEYNEDAPGGVNIGINFPHLHQAFNKEAGMWPGIEQESYALMEFVYSHPEIAMVFSFGETNWCITEPKGGRKAAADLTKIKVPERITKFINADPAKTYTMQEIMELVEAVVPAGMEVTESMVASFLGLGAIVNPMKEDLKFYSALNKKYKEYLKENKMDAERLEPAKAKDGSFELWAYYHLGVPTFSMDLWALPKPEKKKEETGDGLTVEQLEKMSKEEFLELGEEKIEKFLKDSGAPAQYKASMVIGMVKEDKITPEKMAEMMKKMPKPKKEGEEDIDEATIALIEFSDKHLGGKGYIPWESYSHPTLGDIEIGGAVPFAATTPPAEMIDSLLSVQVPWVLTLAGYLPKLEIIESEQKSLGGGVYELNVWVGNTRYLPFPTEMGNKNERIEPAILTIKGKGLEFVSGYKRTSVKQLGGLSNKELKFIIKTKPGTNISLKLDSRNAWGSESQITIGGTK